MDTANIIPPDRSGNVTIGKGEHKRTVHKKLLREDAAVHARRLFAEYVSDPQVWRRVFVFGFQSAKKAEIHGSDGKVDAELTELMRKEIRTMPHNIAENLIHKTLAKVICRGGK